jgi:putative ABC transport system permease protein
MLRTLSNILDVLTMAVGALGSISLLVGGVGIVTIMTIAVTERTSEIGLLVALGAPRRTILGLFLGEAVALSALGGLFGPGARHRSGATDPPAGAGAAGTHAAQLRRPVAELIAIAIGLLAGVLPARRAARLDRSKRCAQNEGRSSGHRERVGRCREILQSARSGPTQRLLN